MLLTDDRLINAPVMSLQTGSEVAQTTRAIVDPGKLQIVAYQVTGPLVKGKTMLLRIEDVREFSDIGLIIDSVDELVELSDVIKLREIYNLGFNPIGMKVTSERKKTLGRVSQCTIDAEGFYIIQLTLKPALFTRLNETRLLIHRSQIIEINNKSIVIEERASLPEKPALTPNASYVNPFRANPDVQSETIQRR